MKYKNEGLNRIAEKYPNIDFTSLDGNLVVPVGAICEKLGIDVVFEKLKDGLAGYFDHMKKIIYVNDNYPATRNLFTIAHEIGHCILHDKINKGYDRREDEYHNYTPEERGKEYEANQFAGQLLMPESQFVEVFKKYDGKFSKIADVFGVSVRACEVRAFNLGLINCL